ncbi:hypothetical protein Y71_20575 [Kosakonia radicincitans DSM 16656]|uniref:hypothetical protein n=1 Tax=Kosakonia radicincitans TaxID=283686 RepID=UPI000272D44D|nr:hypothetical protein [Kosakonia radicincitans]APG16838.1 hypothetical protein A3780_04405 [Kosakonia radicincitans]ARD62193.1 hypothetical protein Y71_20575 [Kosakonia radicincitans DSM 16656]KDE36154.1 hypothetical protein AW40_12970 [Kosakonia radicincitans UMEnt01/12]QEM92864.1 hypothetical protein FEI17_20510 [Kosakonia radicincitans]SET13590.1 hypothetical protein SAMN03159294_2758 [Kosakonia radicincitans]
MKIPLYLKVCLALTLGLVVWAQFFGDDSAGALSGTQTKPAVAQKAKESKKPVVRNESDELADLFPVYTLPVKEKPSTTPVVQEVAFPFQLAGLWISDNQKIIIITDGMQNWLLCSNCGKKDFIQPGDLLTPDWKVQAIEPDHVTIKAMSGQVEKRIDLNSLKIK